MIVDTRTKIIATLSFRGTKNGAQYFHTEICWQMKKNVIKRISLIAHHNHSIRFFFNILNSHFAFGNDNLKKHTHTPNNFDDHFSIWHKIKFNWNAKIYVISINHCDYECFYISSEVKHKEFWEKQKQQKLYTLRAEIFCFPSENRNECEIDSYSKGWKIERTTAKSSNIRILIVHFTPIVDRDFRTKHNRTVFLVNIAYASYLFLVQKSHQSIGHHRHTHTRTHKHSIAFSEWTQQFQR